MSELDPFGIKAAKEKRKEYAITVSVDPGDSEYLFRASYDEIKSAFGKAFHDANFEYQGASHSQLAGTTIEVILTALSIGGGIVAAEMLKNLGKDLWTALRECFSSRSAEKKTCDNGHDTLVLTMTRGDTKLQLSLNNIGVGHQERIRQFLDEALPKLVQLHRELGENEGQSRSPHMMLLPSTERVSLIYANDQIHLWHPLCVACIHLTAPYLDSPCQSCKFYREKPGKHRGRPVVTQTNRNGKQTFFDDFQEPIAAKHLVEYKNRTVNYHAGSQTGVPVAGVQKTTHRWWMVKLWRKTKSFVRTYRG